MRYVVGVHRRTGELKGMKGQGGIFESNTQPYPQRMHLHLKPGAYVAIQKAME